MASSWKTTGGSLAAGASPFDGMHRFYQALLILATLAFSWSAMILAHESGHVLHAWLSGGQVSRTVLTPTVSARTELSHNPHPRFVAWGGAVWGCVIPLLLLGVVRWLSPQHAYLARFFAGFCLIANGAYLASAAWLPMGDASDLLRHGAWRWQLVLFGIATIPLGFYLWNGQGKYFGIGPQAQVVERRAAITMAVAAVAVTVLELAITHSQD